MAPNVADQVPDSTYAGPADIVVRVALLAAALYAATFALLSLDAAARVWIMRNGFETQLDVGFLLVYEGMRMLTIGFAALLAAVLALRARVRSATVPAALFLVLLAVAYAKATTYKGFAGYVQERVARALLADGVPQEVLRVLFGEPAWAIVLAAAAFLRLAVTYPGGVTPAAVLAAGSADRRGMMRDAALAGADVGAIARGLTAGALRRGLLGPLPVWATALILAALTVTDGPLSTAAALAGVLVPILFGVPALRASLATSGEAESARILWFVEAALLSGVAFVVGGLLSVLPGSVAGLLSFVVLATTPTVVLLCLATALSPAGSLEPQRALHATAHHGATVIATVTTFALVQAVVAPAFSADSAMPAVLALLAAAAIAFPAHQRLRAAAARLTRTPLTPAAAAR